MENRFPRLLLYGLTLTVAALAWRVFRPADWDRLGAEARRASGGAARVVTHVVHDYAYAPWPTWWGPSWGWYVQWRPAPAQAPEAAPAQRRRVIVAAPQETVVVRPEAGNPLPPQTRPAALPPPVLAPRHLGRSRNGALSGL